MTASLRVALNVQAYPVFVFTIFATATVLLEAGAYPKLVQELLGAQHRGMTLNTYSHVTAGLSGEAARTIDRVLQLPTVSPKR